MVMNQQQRYERIVRDFNDTESLLRAIGTFQAWTRRVYPNAVLLTTTADNGVPTHIGVYECALQLNSKGYFKTMEQPCPQLIGERVQLGTSIGPAIDRLARLVQELSCWITAFDHAIRLTDTFIVKGNNYSIEFDARNKTTIYTLPN